MTTTSDPHPPTEEPVAGQPTASRWDRLRVTGWPLWGLPLPALVYVLVWDVAAVGLAGSLPGRITTRDLGIAVLLAALCMLQIEAVIGAERTRRRVAATYPRHREAAFVAPTAVWTMAGAMLLPPSLMAVLAGVVYGYRFVRVERPRLAHARGPGYRGVFTAASVILASLAAWALLAVTGFDPRTDLPGPVPLVIVLGAILIYSVVQFGLVAGAVTLAAQSLAPARTMLVSWGQHGTELIQLSIGAIGAILLTSSSPWMTVLLAPVLWLLTRAALATELEREAATDSATELMTAAAWHRRAAGLLSRSRRRGTPLGILLVDVDSLRTINNRYGAHAGDVVLLHTAHALRDTLRPDDLIGRMHGEEFAVVAPSGSDSDLTELANRLCRAVEALELTEVVAGPEAATSSSPTDPDLTITVGLAQWPVDGDTIDAVLAAADTALRLAKQQGPGSVAEPTREHSSTPG